MDCLRKSKPNNRTNGIRANRMPVWYNINKEGERSPSREKEIKMIKLSQPWMNHGITFPIGTTFESVKKLRRGTIYSFILLNQARGETLVENGNVPGGTDVA